MVLPSSDGHNLVKTSGEEGDVAVDGGGAGRGGGGEAMADQHYEEARQILIENSIK